MPEDDATKGISRRDFMKEAAVIGAGAVALTGLGRTEAAAEVAGKEGPALSKQEIISTVKGGSSAQKYEEMLKVARERLYPKCRVCPECDGKACAGEWPGMGGIGSGRTFINNVEDLAKLHLVMRTLHNVSKPDTSFTLWGEKLDFPILAACTGGTTYNMGGKIGEDEFIGAVIGGCTKAGTMGMAADGIGDPLSVYETRLKAIAANGGRGIAIIKPRTQEEIIKRIKLVEASGARAVGIDIDSAGKAARSLPGQTVEPKTLAQLKELVKATKLPFIVKGITTPEEAEIAWKAGAAAVVASNHGGRVLDHLSGTAVFLPKIVERVKGKVLILCDGGVRYGTDVLKYLALGADAVLVGRPIVRGAFGGGPDGVALVLNKMKTELIDAMVLTGTPNVRKVKKNILA
jgi:isopentenyl diphosphate isomerase/L-lactate dehydrogenase-like FMN-dependent dehydrogenase